MDEPASNLGFWKSDQGLKSDQAARRWRTHHVDHHPFPQSCFRMCESRFAVLKAGTCWRTDALGTS